MRDRQATLKQAHRGADKPLQLAALRISRRSSKQLQIVGPCPMICRATMKPKSSSNAPTHTHRLYGFTPFSFYIFVHSDVWANGSIVKGFLKKSP